MVKLNKKDKKILKAHGIVFLWQWQKRVGWYETEYRNFKTGESIIVSKDAVRDRLELYPTGRTS